MDNGGGSSPVVTAVEVDVDDGDDSDAGGGVSNSGGSGDRSMTPLALLVSGRRLRKK